MAAAAGGAGTGGEGGGTAPLADAARRADGFGCW